MEVWEGNFPALTMTYREALNQYKEAYKVLFGLELTSISPESKIFEKFLQEIVGSVQGVKIVSTTFEVDGVTILQHPGI